jgi:hypothetical protein
MPSLRAVTASNTRLRRCGLLRPFRASINILRDFPVSFSKSFRDTFFQRFTDDEPLIMPCVRIPNHYRATSSTRYRLPEWRQRAHVVPNALRTLRIHNDDLGNAQRLRLCHHGAPHADENNPIYDDDESESRTHRGGGRWAPTTRSSSIALTARRPQCRVIRKSTKNSPERCRDLAVPAP